MFHMKGVMNNKGQAKLLAAVAVFAMVVCCFAITMPSDDVQAATTEITESDFEDEISDGVYEVTGEQSVKLTGPLDIDQETTISGTGTLTITYEHAGSTDVVNQSMIVLSNHLTITGGVNVVFVLKMTSGATVPENSELSVFSAGVLNVENKAIVTITQDVNAHGRTWISSTTGQLNIDNATVDFNKANSFTMYNLNMENGAILKITNPNYSSNLEGSVENSAIVVTGQKDGYNLNLYDMTMENSSVTSDGTVGVVDSKSITADSTSSVTAKEIEPFAYAAKPWTITLNGGTYDADIKVPAGDTLDIDGNTTLNGELKLEATGSTKATLALKSGAELTVANGGSVKASAGTVTFNEDSSIIAAPGSSVALPSETANTNLKIADGADVTIGGVEQDSNLENIEVSTEAELKNAIKNGFKFIEFKPTDTTSEANVITITENYTLPEGTVLTINAANVDAILKVGTGVTFTIANGATIVLDDNDAKKAKISVETGASMFVGGNIIGPEGTTEGTIDNAGTVSFDTASEVKTDLTGNGVYNLSDAMKTVYIREDVNSNLVFLPQQTVIIESGYNITISGTSRMVVQGNLIVEDGASINVKKGGLLYIYGNTASATIAGTITSNGISIVSDDRTGAADGSKFAGVTIDIGAAQSADSVIDISGTLQSKSCNGELAIDLNTMNGGAAGNGSIELSGELTVASKSAAEFNGLEVLEGGVLTVNGTVGATTLSNAGTVVMNGTATGNVTVKMQIGGTVDIKSLKGAMTVTDDGMYLSMVRINDVNVPVYVGDENSSDWGVVANTITFSNIKGALITEDATYEVISGYENRMPVNKMYLSGTLTGAVKDTIGTVSIDNGTVIVPDLEAETDLSIGKTSMTIRTDATLDVVGYVMAVDIENDDAIGGAGSIVVSAGTVKTYNAIDGPSVTAVHYEATESGVTYNYYTTLAKAIDAGATDMDALGVLDILEDITLPSGSSLEAGTVNVGSSSVQDVTFTVESGAKFTAGTVNVYGTMDVMDIDDISVSIIYSDTETLDGDHAIYTNLANALANATDGSVTITKRGDGIAYLRSNATVAGDVTLVIPAGKQLYIMNGVTLTVAGTIDNKGGISAFYDGTGGAINAGNFGLSTGTGADSEKKAVIDLDGGFIQSTTEMPYETAEAVKGYYIPGAYYTIDNKKSYIITTIERAAPAIGTADAKVVETYGSVTGTTATFTGEEYYNATLNVYGDLTMESLILKDTKMTVKGTTSKLNGTFGSAEGTVTFEHIKAAANSYLYDRIVESGDVKTPTLFVSGSFTKDKDTDYAFVDALVQFDGVVKVVQMNIDLDGSITGYSDTNDGNVIISSGADVAFAKNLSTETMRMDVKNLTMTIEGTFTVDHAATFDATGTADNIYDDATVVILGTLTVAEKTDTQASGTAKISKLYVGGTPEDISCDRAYSDHLGTGAAAAVNGAVSGIQLIFQFPGSTVDEENTKGFMSVEFYYDADTLIVTVWGKQNTEVGHMVYPAQYIGNNLMDGWKYLDSNGVYQYTGAKSSYAGGRENYTSVKIGQYDKVYANVDFEPYKLSFNVDAGVDQIAVDGQIVATKGIGDEYTGSAMVSAGKHVIEVKLSNMYASTDGAVKISFNGQELTVSYNEKTGIYSAEITISADTYAGEIFGVTINNVAKTGSMDVSSEDQGMGITDYLLIVLVVLIAIMAIVLVLRLMRS